MGPRQSWELLGCPAFPPATPPLPFAASLAPALLGMRALTRLRGPILSPCLCEEQAGRPLWSPGEMRGWGRGDTVLGPQGQIPILQKRNRLAQGHMAHGAVTAWGRASPMILAAVDAPMMMERLGAMKDMRDSTYS